MVIPDGTETIGTYWFNGSQIESVAIPTSVREIREYAFCQCKYLKQAIFEQSSELEAIEHNCFRRSGLEEIVLPKMLKYVDADSFSDCGSLSTIYVEDGCEADLFDLNISDSTHVGPLPETMVGGVRVWDLRKLKDAVIPEGTERIGNHWF